MISVRPLKVLTFSSLYPNAARPQYAVFVENRLRHLISSGQVEARVMAPVPWFPVRNSNFGQYATHASVPRHERRHGIDISHPRYPVVPKVGMSLAPLLMYLWCRPAIADLLRGGYAFDLIDAHYFYPDGVAAALLGRHFGKPVTITARGTDINVIAKHALPRRMIRWAANQAAALITVSRALEAALTDLGIDPDRIRTLRNGVDLNAFRLDGQADLRNAANLRPPVVASVGNLLPAKGHDLVIRSLLSIPGATLLIVGQGPDERRLRALATSLNLEARVRFLGSMPHDRMYEVYNMADVLVLASEREGWPNVLLEAMACGTPVAATNVNGIPEVVAAPEAGRLLTSRDPDSIATAVRSLLANPPGRAATRAYAERFGWDATTAGQIELFTRIVGPTGSP